MTVVSIAISEIKVANMSETQNTSNQLLSEIRDLLATQETMYRQHLERQRELIQSSLELQRQRYSEYLSKAQSRGRAILFWLMIIVSVTMAIIIADWVLHPSSRSTAALASYLMSIGQKAKFDRSGNVIAFAAHSTLQTDPIPFFGVTVVDEQAYDVGHEMSPNPLFVDSDLLRIRPFQEINRLELYDTGITDAGLEHLSAFAELAHLDLYNTRVTDSGLQHLRTLAALKYLDLRKTSVTDVGVAALREQLPECQVQYSTGVTAEEIEGESQSPVEEK